MQYKLTYLVATRNKLPHLIEAIGHLLAAVQSDEEVVVIDGASTDGSIQFLEKLYRQGRIHQFVSEPDVGEAHAWNKGLLLAQGELIKVISDDDVYDYSAIRRCRKFMLEHSEVNILATDGAGITTEYQPDIPFKRWPFTEEFRKLCNGKKAIEFCGLGLMFRRSELSLTGLFHTGIAWIDGEFTYRITSASITVGWFSGCTWVRIANAQSSLKTRIKQIEIDWQRVDYFYTGKVKKHLWKWPRKYRLVFRNFLAHIYRSVFPRKQSKPLEKLILSELYLHCEQWMAENNKKQKGEFLVRVSRED